MATKTTATTAFFLLVNLLFVALASSQVEGPVSPPPPTENPSPPVVAPSSPPPATPPIESPPSPPPLSLPPPPSSPPVEPPSAPPVVPPSAPPVVPPSTLPVVPPFTPPVVPPSTPPAVPPSPPSCSAVPTSILPATTTTTAPPPPPPRPIVGVRCLIDAVGLRICAPVLFALRVTRIRPPRGACCALIDRLSNEQAAVCLCFAASNSFLGLNLQIPEDVALLLNFCGRPVPAGLSCP
ncbi:unnamed protein product [Spirodela intermedia]|uniref:Hydrophobic seed protein domain-containing protein n=1 Tax=Spirodela intermedia TaxID=51605 RepID=A0ABN7E8Z7_SPIIN|nr:unnamed protein product [Spirodela intermedia]